MSHVVSWIHSPIAEALGWTLVHFVWEGAVLAMILMAMLRLLRAEPARRRYAVACAILAAMPVVFGITLAVIWARRPMGVAMPIRWAAVSPSAGPLDVAAHGFSWRAILDRLAWDVPVWFAGVAFFYARGLAGWAAVRRMRRRGVCAAPAEWRARLDELAARLRIARPVLLLESCLTDTPVLIGYLRPVILLPVGCLTGLSVAQVECILLHELAHVARHDYLVNLLQSLVEGLLFYHPAVWWVSRVVRAERENCCDDRVVELMGNARVYVATLAMLEQRRALALDGALAANGGNLMKRIRRLTMEPRGVQVSVAPAFSAALLLAIFAASLAALPAPLPPARKVRIVPAPARLATFAVTAAAPQQSATNIPTPYRKWLEEDVVYIIADDERSAFLALTTDAEREHFIEQFWKRRDPSPDTEENEYREEHYRRIAYSNEHFAGSMAGWKTDRGRIYITYGPPDEIDDHSSGGSYQRPPEEGGGKTSTYPFQQWRYRLIDGIGSNVIVEFVDRDGTGDYPMTKDPATKEKQAYRKWLNEDAAYIIGDEERAAFQKLPTDEQRDDFIQQFWQQRGPAAREEHYRRIAYANEHFGTGIPGWKTDLGRIYIVYGPPDEIHNAGARTIEWTYRAIDGIGKNITVEFQDQLGNGEFHMTKDPAQNRAAKAVAANDGASVRVSVSGNGHPAPGVIGVEDFLDVRLAAPNVQQDGHELAVLRDEASNLKQTLKASVDQLRDLEQNLAKSTAELKAAQETLASNAQMRPRVNQLLGEAQLAKEEFLAAVQQAPDSPQAKQARDKMEAKKGELGKFLEAHPSVLLEANALDLQTKQSAVGNISQKIQSAKQWLVSLESRLNENARQQAQLHAVPGSGGMPVGTRVAVATDGNITLDNAKNIHAAGLTPAQLEAAIGAGSSVRILRKVTVFVPLSATTGHSHVFGQVTAHGRIVQSFENDVSGGPSTKQSFPLRPGTYHLTVVVKNMATGTSQPSELDFTVD